MIDFGLSRSDSRRATRAHADDRGLGRRRAGLVTPCPWCAGGVPDKRQIHESLAELLLAAHRAAQLELRCLGDGLDPDAMRRSMKGSGLRLASRSAKWVAVIVHGGMSCRHRGGRAALQPWSGAISSVVAWGGPAACRIPWTNLIVTHIMKATHRPYHKHKPRERGPCAMCRVQFWAWRADRRYCSDRCRVRAMRKRVELRDAVLP
jgi:hypothetical protein